MLYEVKTVDRPVRFVPEFLLEGHQRMKDDEGFTKVYPDRVIPVAIGADSHAGRPQPEVPHVGRDVPRDRRGRKPVGRGHVGRHRSADRPVLGLRVRADQRLPVEGRAGRVQAGRLDRSRAANSTERPSSSTSGGPATSTSSTRKKSATGFPEGLTTSGFTAKKRDSRSIAVRTAAAWRRACVVCDARAFKH